MEYGRLYGDLYAHPKVVDLRNAELGVWTRCVSWAIHHHDTQGFLPRSVPGMFQDGADDVADLIAALAEHGLWVPDGRGWRVHNWPRRQPDVSRLEQAREAGRRGGQLSAVARRERHGTAQPRRVSETPFDDPFEANGRRVAEGCDSPPAPPLESESHTPLHPPGGGMGVQEGNRYRGPRRRPVPVNPVDARIDAIAEGRL